MSKGKSTIALRYQAIYTVLRTEILSGVYQPGEQFPTEYEIMARFEASRTTVRSALKLLQEDGLIASRRGSGTTVLPAGSNVSTAAYSRYTDVHDVDFFFAIDPPWEESSSRAVIDRTLAAQPIAKALDVAVGTEVFRIRWLLSVNGIPFNLHTHYLCTDTIPDLEERKNEDLFATYKVAASEYHLLLTEAKEDILPICASFIESSFLNVPEGTPLLKLCRTSYCQKGALEYSETIINPEILRISLTLRSRMEPDIG